MQWTMENDKQSVHVGINHRIGLCRQQRLIPVRILLGREHSFLFMCESGWQAIPKGPHYYGPKNTKIPLLFNTPHIYGIAIETKPR